MAALRRAAGGVLYEMLRFRQQIFVVEQRSPYLDLDGFDRMVWHLLARCGARAAAGRGPGLIARPVAYRRVT